MTGKVSFHLPPCALYGYVSARKHADRLLERTTSTSWSEEENANHEELLISTALGVATEACRTSSLIERGLWRGTKAPY
jgi:hypothetical protein